MNKMCVYEKDLWVGTLRVVIYEWDGALFMGRYRDSPNPDSDADCFEDPPLNSLSGWHKHFGAAQGWRFLGPTRHFSSERA